MTIHRRRRAWFWQENRVFDFDEQWREIERREKKGDGDGQSRS